MANNFRLKLLNPERAIKVRLNNAFNFVLSDLDKWVRRDLVKAMVHGGLGIQGIADTPFYHFISSPRGLSELGIEATEPPKLLQAYENTITVKREGLQLEIKFGDLARLKTATPHPAAGTGHLNVESWLEWIVDGTTVGRGFVPRQKLPERVDKYVRLGSPLGGLMLPRGQLGSMGLWRFPGRFKNYDEKWLRDNLSHIEDVIINQLTVFLARRIRG